nr:MAG TPA: hypothetical protein [Caudoviricetes sp.]
MLKYKVLGLVLFFRPHPCAITGGGNYFAVPPSIYRIKATLGILTLLRITVTGNPSSSGCCLAISLIQCGLQFSAPAAWAGVITSLSSALISARVICFHLLPACVYRHPTP